MCSRVRNNFYSWSFVLYDVSYIFANIWELHIFRTPYANFAKNYKVSGVKGSIEIVSGWVLAEWFGASSCQSQSCNSSGFDPSILRHSGIWGAADEAVLNNVHNKTEIVRLMLCQFFIFIVFYLQVRVSLCVWPSAAAWLHPCPAPRYGRG